MTSDTDRDLEKEREDLLRLADSNVDPDVRQSIDIAVSALTLEPLPSYEIVCEDTSGAVKG